MQAALVERSYDAIKHTGIVMIKQESGKWEPMGSCVLWYVFGRHCVIMTGHGAQKILDAGTTWRILVGPAGREHSHYVNIRSMPVVVDANNVRVQRNIRGKEITVRGKELAIDLAVVWLNPEEVNALRPLPEVEFYNRDWIHKKYGPIIDPRKPTRDNVTVASVGFQAEMTERIKEPEGIMPVVSIHPSLGCIGKLDALEGEYLHFLVGSLNADDNPGKWRGCTPSEILSREGNGLDNLGGISGAGVWRVDYMPYRNGDFPIRLIGMIYYQSLEIELPHRCYVTALSYNTLKDYLFRRLPA